MISFILLFTFISGKTYLLLVSYIQRTMQAVTTIIRIVDPIIMMIMRILNGLIVIYLSTNTAIRYMTALDWPVL